MNIDDLRALRDESLEQLGSDSLADQYERGAILMGWEGLTGEQAAKDADTLRIELRGVDRVGSYAAGRISTALQNAVAYIGKYQLNPKLSPQTSLTADDRRKYEIVQESQVGGTLVYRVPAIPMEPAGLITGKYATAAANAVRELIDTLPAADDDAWTADGVLGAPALIRRAVHGVSSAVADLPDGFAMDLVPERGDAIHAALSRPRASGLRDELNDRDDRVTEEIWTGLLDGLRGTRRVFYLVDDSETEIAGAVDADMVGEVSALEHQRVRVRLETRQWVKGNGKLGKKAYRLLSIEQAPEQQTLI